LRTEGDAGRIRRLARELGRVVAPGTRMYLTGGATVVLEGWRDSTVDIDVRFEPDSDAALSRIRDLKEEPTLNVELASTLDFLPPLPGWEERSRFRLREGQPRGLRLQPYSRALSKLQRGFDLEDVTNLIDSGQVEPVRLGELFEAIESDLFRFPAADGGALRTAVASLAE